MTPSDRLRSWAAVVLALGAIGPTSITTRGFAQPDAGASAWRVAAGTVTAVCRLTLGGSFEAVSSDLTGAIAIAAGRPGAVDGTLHVALDSFDTGIGLRNTHMRERYLETGKGPDFAQATLSGIALARPDIVTTGGRSAFDATLLLHGVRRAVRGEVRLRSRGQTLEIDARFPLHLPEYGIPEPRYLGIGVRDEVEVRVEAVLTAAGAAR